MKTCLAIDIGASGGRHIAGWLAEGKLQLKEIYRFENSPVPKNGHLVWDVDALFAHIKNGLKEAKKQGITPESIAIDTWAVDFVLLDAQEKRLGDAVSYRDHRTQGMDLELQKHITGLGGCKTRCNRNQRRQQGMQRLLFLCLQSQYSRKGDQSGQNP